MILAEKPLISVIVPIYNVDNYLKGCIDSILNQTYHNLQIILVDDGSTDLSGAICDEYAYIDKRVEVYHKTNAGLVTARKEGLKHAKGEFVGFVDGDDYIDNTMYDVLYENILLSYGDMVHVSYYEEYKNVSVKKLAFDSTIIELKDIKDHEKVIREYILEMNPDHLITPSIWSKLFRCEFIKKCYENVPDECQLGEDLICLFNTLFEASRIVLVSESLYHYRIRQESISRIYSSDYLKKEVLLSESIFSIINKFNIGEKFKEELNIYIGRRLVHAINNLNYNNRIQEYYFEDINLLKGKRIVLYGAGAVGIDYYFQIKKMNECNLICWVDSNYYNKEYDKFEIWSPEIIGSIEYDVLLIAVEDKKIADDIKKAAIDYGAKCEKIVWVRPSRLI